MSSLSSDALVKGLISDRISVVSSNGCDVVLNPLTVNVPHTYKPEFLEN